MELQRAFGKRGMGEGQVQVSKGPCSSARLCDEGKACSAAVFSCCSPRAPSLPLPANHSLLLMCPPISAPNEGSTSSKSSLVLTLLLCAKFWALYKKYHLIMKNCIKKGCKRLAWETLKLSFSSLCTQLCNYKNALFIHACLFCSCFGEMLFLWCERVLFFPPQSKCKCHHQVTTGALGYRGCDPHFPQRGPRILSSHFSPFVKFQVPAPKPQEPRL